LTLFAFAGIYRWTTVPLAVGTAIVAVLSPPRFGRGATRWLDGALLAAIVVIAIELIPLPGPVRVHVAPSSIAYEHTVRIAPTESGPITVDSDATAFALFLIMTVVLLFWAARRAFAHRGVRTVLRSIAWTGLIVAPLAIAQHLFAPKLFYGVVRPISANALPFTPFVNRNDFAAWLLMAIPVTQGYVIARIASRRHHGDPFDPETALDTRNLMLGFAVFAMTAGLLASLSRSGIGGAVASFALFVALARRRMSRRRLTWMIVAMAAMVTLALMYANTSALAARASSSLTEGISGRSMIWRMTWPIVQDFWPVGSGVGTFQPVMVLYQTPGLNLYVSHADNEYLQILAEGGALLAIPVLVALVAAFIAIRERLNRDRTPLFWVRLGAACGIFGLALQNLWEMTLRVPANAVLLAILAAIALHES
jgi:O-antigen ligase